jgi:flagellum-specific ATP synthase
MATYADMEELIRLGAYRAGIQRRGRRGDQATGIGEGYRQLEQILQDPQ